MKEVAPYDRPREKLERLGASGLGNVMMIDVYRATANFPLCIEGDPSDTLADGRRFRSQSVVGNPVPRWRPSHAGFDS